MTLPEPMILYVRTDCHLCDQVVTMLEKAGIRWRPVDIDGDPGLVEKYGLSVPVLRRPGDNCELYYPFDEPALRRFADSAA